MGYADGLLRALSQSRSGRDRGRSRAHRRTRLHGSRHAGRDRRAAARSRPAWRWNSSATRFRSKRSPRAANTISYEILTSLSHRAHRASMRPRHEHLCPHRTRRSDITSPRSAAWRSSRSTSVTACFRPPIYWKLIVQQIMRIGYFSLPVVGLTAFFTGGVLALADLYRRQPLRRRSLRAAWSCWSASRASWAR